MGLGQKRPAVQEAASDLEERALGDAAGVETAGATGADGFEGVAPSATAGLLGSVPDGEAELSEPLPTVAAAGFTPDRPVRLSFL